MTQRPRNNVRNHNVFAEAKNLSRSLPDRERKQLLENITKAAKLVKEEARFKRQELNHLRMIASANSLLQVFQHDVKSLVGSLGTYELMLNNLQKDLPPAKVSSIKEIQSYFNDSKGRFNDLLDMTSLLSAKEFSTDDTVALHQRVKRAHHCFKLICSRYKINLDYSDVKSSLVLNKISEAEVVSIIINVLSNSIKSVIASEGEKKVKINGTRDDSGKTIIEVRDTGIGLDHTDQNLFNAFTADPKGELYSKLNSKINPEDKYIVGTGSGLGLSIIKEIISVHKGSVCFKAPTPPWNCHLEIILP